MEKKQHKFPVQHQTKRHQKDLLFFALPALLIYAAGLVVSAKDGYDGLLEAIWALVREPAELFQLSVYNILGLALIVVGLSIALTGTFTLGRFYSSTLVTRADHQLITHGIYHFVRHPIYFGALLAVMGAPVYVASLYGFLIMTALIPLVLYRIRLEERMLIEEFGADYRTYQETTSKLVPFIY